MHPIQTEMMLGVVQADRARDASMLRRARRGPAHAGRIRTLAGKGLIGTGDRLRRAGSRLTGATA